MVFVKFVKLLNIIQVLLVNQIADSGDKVRVDLLILSLILHEFVICSTFALQLQSAIVLSLFLGGNFILSWSGPHRYEHHCIGQTIYHGWLPRLSFLVLIFPHGR